MKATLHEKKEIAEGTLFLDFDTEEDLVFRPGQFFRLTLTNPDFTDDRGNSRFLGLTNTPSQNRKAQTITRLGPSAFKRSLKEMQPGAGAEVDGVGGTTILPDDPGIPVVIITGGIGITPIMGILQWIKEKSLGHKITLLYSNSSQARTIWMDEIATIASENTNLKIITTVTGDPAWPGEKRRFDAQFFKEKIEQPENNVYFITGTPRFVPAMVISLHQIGIKTEQMKFEIFTGY